MAPMKGRTMSERSKNAYLPYELTPEEVKAIDRRKLMNYVEASDPFSRVVIWVFQPHLLRRLVALFRGNVVWII